MGGFNNLIVPTPDSQYLEILRDVLENGYEKDTRSGKTISKFGKSMRFDLQEGFPLLTTKKMYFRGIVYELLWFLKGSTNIGYLVYNDVHIWDDDAYRFYKELVAEHNRMNRKIHVDPKTVSEETAVSKEEFIECVKAGAYRYFLRPSGGDEEYKVMKYTFGDLGPVYGKQWRAFGHSDFDQIGNIIDTLKNNPDDRRMLCVAYNPDMVPEMALPPCHVMFQFYTRKLTKEERWGLYFEKFKYERYLPGSFTRPHLDKYGDSKLSACNEEREEDLDREEIPERGLSCSFYCRSQDLPLGTPYNIASYALLVHIIARCVNMMPDELVYNGGDCHIYENQIEGVKEQLERDPFKYASPKLHISEGKENLEDFTGDDFSLIGYESYPKIKFPLSVG